MSYTGMIFLALPGHVIGLLLSCNASSIDMTYMLHYRDADPQHIIVHKLM